MRSLHALTAGSALLVVLLLGGCATLPTTGPTAGQVVRAANAPDNNIGMRLVDISSVVITELNQANSLVDQRVATLASLAHDTGTTPSNDLVGPGDILAIGIYEVGVGLFGGMTAGDNSIPAARAEEFATVPVEQTGFIKLPYVGALKVSGLTTSQIGALIERGYTRRSQAPQALVAIKRNLSNTIYVTGDVRRPGRIELSLRRERLLDVIADAGGSISQSQDMVVRVSREGEIVEERLDHVRAGTVDDITMRAGDVVELIKEPQTYSVFGAVPKVTQIPFDQTDLTLAEAVARAGGPNDALANPKAIFLFRYVPSPDGTPPKPIIYRLNMMQPQGYFLSQNFAMRNKDVVYISNASINRVSKLVGIINQLTSPFITARVLTQ